MAIQRWDPLRDLLELQERMKRLFDDAIARSAGPAGAESVATEGWRPPMDLVEEADRFVLRVDLPGVSSDEVDLRVDDGTLHLRGERRMENNVSRDAFLRIERPHGPFEAQLALPASVDQGSIQASHDKGVIEIVLPKKEARAPSRIRVASDSSAD